MKVNPLTPDESNLISVFVKAFQQHRGKGHAVSASTIAKKMNIANENKLMSGVRVRKIVRYIRINKLVEDLISSGKGYFIATTKQEVREYVNKTLAGRRDQIQRLMESYKLK